MAAKSVSISTDDVTYYTLPGMSGELANEAGEIDDTIFGQSYKSSQTGLINWSVKGQGFYKGFAGYVAVIKKPGTTTSFTGEATTQIGATNQYQITDTTKRVWDRSQTFVVYDNAVDHTADVTSFDYLFGQVTFDSGYTVTGPVTIDGYYFPMAQIAKGQEFTLTQTTDAIDTTDFETAQGNSGRRTFIYGLKTLSLDIGGVYALTNGWVAALEARSELIIEINPDGSDKSIARGFFKPITASQAGNVGALEKETLKFSLQVPDLSNPGLDYPFAWQHDPTTTLSMALQIALTAWTAGNLVYVKYLWDGVAGYKGSAVLTDMTLKGGIEVMNDFTVNFQGTDAITTV